MFGDPVSAAVTKLEVAPAESCAKPAPKQQLTVTARFADGSDARRHRTPSIHQQHPHHRRDVRRRRRQPVRKGEAAMLVRYEGKLSVVNVTALYRKAGFTWTPVSPNTTTSTNTSPRNCSGVRLLPSDLTTDAEFLRRVSVDLIGLPPDARKRCARS